MNAAAGETAGSAGISWIRIAVVYFVIAVALGIFMGISGDHSLATVHAHLNLLGWVSMALIGLIYLRLPALGHSKLAKVQFWLHNAGLPVMMLTLAAKFKGYPQFDPVLGVGSLVVAVAVLLFAANVWLGTKAP